MTYEALSAFAQTWGLLYFIIIFGCAVAYALWPTNARKFRKAAEIPMKEKERDDDRPLN